MLHLFFFIWVYIAQFVDVSNAGILLHYMDFKIHVEQAENAVLREKQSSQGS